MVAAICAVDTSASCIKPVMPVKQYRIVHGVHGGAARVAQCPHERRSGAPGRRCGPPWAIGARHSCSCAFAGDDTSTQRWTFEIDAMGAVDDTVENGVSQGRIAEHDVTPQYWNDCHP